MTQRLTVKFDITIDQTPDQHTVLGITGVEFTPFDPNPVLVAFGTMQFLQFLTTKTPPEYFVQESRAQRLFDQIRHFATYLESESFMKPLNDKP